MIRMDSVGFRAVFSLLLIVGLLYLPSPAYSQDEGNLQNLILNGGFEEGFQEEHGVAYGWGGFSNGNALVGWGADSWDPVVAAGDKAQMIEVKNATEMNRYAGIYQTVSVVPGAQYRLTIMGLVRSTEGDIEVSDYGYRLQYAIDGNGGTTWELVPESAWTEISWDEQPLSDSAEMVYRVERYETTVTAQSDRLTLFIRGWKKWINEGSGIFDVDEISLVGPAPENFEIPAAEAAVVSNPAALNDTPLEEAPAPAIEEEANKVAEVEEPVAEVVPETDVSIEAPEAAPQAENSQLPVSGQGRPEALNYIVLSGGVMLVVLVMGAVVALRRQES